MMRAVLAQDKAGAEVGSFREARDSAVKALAELQLQWDQRKPVQQSGAAAAPVVPAPAAGSG